jgi:hypothetical protein
LLLLLLLQAARAALHPMTLLGDNLSDLPVVSNFEEVRKVTLFISL